MNSLETIQNRVSVTKVKMPAPTPEQLLGAFRAAARAADHGKLKPWRFLVIQEDGLVALSELFVRALRQSNPNASESIVEKTRNMPFRAPLIVVAIAKVQAHIKVPDQEQIIACGAATQNLLNAFFAMGFGAVWRSGEMATNELVKKELLITPSEQILGYIYVGTPVDPVPQPEPIQPESLFSQWPVK